MPRFNGVYVTLLVIVSTAFKSDRVGIKPAVGDIAPDIEMINSNGEITSLSSLRGKVVLVDFWASWCKTCRIENSTLRDAYSQFKNSKFNIGDGFEIYSVSLDSDSITWQKAIRNDRLYWESHVSDFKKWDSPVVTSYNFSYLPHNLLLDSEGEIIAKGLIGDQLLDTLAAHMAD
jgi:thiol-disulfide isomerase/thioredoxin